MLLPFRIAPPGENRNSLNRAPSIPVVFKSGGSFHPPPNLCPPVIMIGPGTGVSPFVGFLQERDHLRGCKESDNSSNEIGEAWLFFGCRRAEEDFLFRSQLESFEANGCLTKLIVAYSRAQEQKVYVQVSYLISFFFLVKSITCLCGLNLYILSLRAFMKPTMIHELVY